MKYNRDMADDFISIGYDLHIYDQDGKYPNDLDRGDWVNREITRIEQRHPQQQDSADNVTACDHFFDQNDFCIKCEYYRYRNG